MFYSILQHRDRDQSIQDDADEELEAAREADSFSFGPRHKFTNTRLESAMSNARQQLHMNDLEKAGIEILAKTRYRAKQKGMGCFASNHEILGYTMQETNEYEQAIHQRRTDEEKVQELIDIAVCALWGIASIRSGGVDW